MNGHTQEHGWMGEPESKLSLDVGVSVCNKSKASSLSFLRRNCRFATLGMSEYTLLGFPTGVKNMGEGGSSKFDGRGEHESIHGGAWGP